MLVIMNVFDVYLVHCCPEVYVCDGCITCDIVSYNLCLQAKDMVALSKNISTKIKDKQGDITEDEVSDHIL